MTDEPKPLPARQAEAYEFIKANCRLYGPTVREIAMAMGIGNPNGVTCHLKALEKKGLIRRTANAPRGIEVVA